MRHRKANRAHPSWRVLPILLLLGVCGNEETPIDNETQTKHDDNITYTTEEAQARLRTFIDFHDPLLPNNSDLGALDPLSAARQVWSRVGSSSEERIAKVFEKARTKECRAMIAEHFGHFIHAFGIEEAAPFADLQLENSCPEPVYYEWDSLPEGTHWGLIQNREYKPEDAEYIDDPKNLRLAYAILTHTDPDETIRLIEALHVDGYHFLVHVDGKETSESTYRALVDYSAGRSFVHVLPSPYRTRINWGGFQMVNATLQLLKYAFAIGDDFTHEPLEFHKLVHIASTSYPIQSNTAIQNRLAKYPLDANHLHVIMRPTRPYPGGWFYFIECDDALHRISRLRPLSSAEGGIELFTSSQWFVISREFALYLAEAKPGTMVHGYLDYIRHVVVADETFFGTVLRNTHFCEKHDNWHFLHLEFDRWESELGASERDERKCMMKDPNQCGRSPTTMTMEYLDVLELTGDLFARKFDDKVDAQIRRVLDERRLQQEFELTGRLTREKPFNTNFEGHGVLIVARETVSDEMPLCMGLGPSGNDVRLVRCFHDDVPKTFAEDWETGAVVEQETLANNRWKLGPCSTDGRLERSDTGLMSMTPGMHSNIGPRCMLKVGDGLREGRCLDADIGKTRPGGEMKVFPCVNGWNQYISFGDGTYAPLSSMHTKVPKHIISGLALKKFEQEDHMCVAVYGRGDEDEDWTDQPGYEAKNESFFYSEDKHPLSVWEGQHLVTTKCSNKDAVIQWLFVPFIVEDDSLGNSTSPKMEGNPTNNSSKDDDDESEGEL